MTVGKILPVGRALQRNKSLRDDHKLKSGKSTNCDKTLNSIYKSVASKDTREYIATKKWVEQVIQDAEELGQPTGPKASRYILATFKKLVAGGYLKEKSDDSGLLRLTHNAHLIVKRITTHMSQRTFGSKMEEAQGVVSHWNQAIGEPKLTNAQLLKDNTRLREERRQLKAENSICSIASAGTNAGGEGEQEMEDGDDDINPASDQTMVDMDLDAENSKTGPSNLPSTSIEEYLHSRPSNDSLPRAFDKRSLVATQSLGGIFSTLSRALLARAAPAPQNDVQWEALQRMAQQKRTADGRADEAFDELHGAKRQEVRLIGALTDAWGQIRTRDVTIAKNVKALRRAKTQAFALASQIEIDE